MNRSKAVKTALLVSYPMKYVSLCLWKTLWCHEPWIITVQDGSFFSCPYLLVIIHNMQSLCSLIILFLRELFLTPKSIKICSRNIKVLHKLLLVTVVWHFPRCKMTIAKTPLIRKLPVSLSDWMFSPLGLFANGQCEKEPKLPWSGTN